ncbi:MAG: bifunctional UDP-N-acetylmuramoyl-tripeptide:D-alanyl-D-alanine ligase/alanine racemase, partial [Cyclobacteriaceae bacterium]|nr:bifunctional UDP-N-acetylmuramoyl-tripeptide:D-alanyl-D-alanine ligase/alanine racemase [Cyclobacteriaceae bacterium]
AHHDGHQFMHDLYDKGTRCFVVEDPAFDGSSFADACIMKVPDSVRAMQQLAAYHRRQFSVPVVGITGSNGKTTVKEWLASILSEKYLVVKSPKSYNSQTGVPLSVWEMNSSHEVAVFEAGISRSGEMEHLQPVIRPTLGLMTNLGPAHNEGFVDLAHKRSEKAKLFEGCTHIVCCREQEETFHYLSRRFPGKVAAWSLHDPEAAFYFQRKDNLYQVAWHGTAFSFHLPFDFPVWIENALHAVSLALLAGCGPGEIQKGLSHIHPMKMRLEIKEGQHGCYLIDDTYNNDLQGLRVALDFMKKQQQLPNRTLILSDLLQTGKEPAQLYQEVNQLLLQHGIGRLIGIGTSLSANAVAFSMPHQMYGSTAAFLDDPPVFTHEMVLVKGARHFHLERIVQRLQAKHHGTLLEINFEALAHNLNTYKRQLKPGTRLMVMTKAFAYGGGSLEIANVLQYHQVDAIGVAYMDEALHLRRHGIHLPIMVMNADPEHYEILAENHIEVEIYSMRGLAAVAQLERPPQIHIKLETGMNRLGFVPESIGEVCDYLTSNPQVRVAGVFTHFSSADDPLQDQYTHQQARLFEEGYQALADTLGYRPVRHAVNSSGIDRFPAYHYDMVRLGIGLYGHGTLAGLRPVSTLKTHISQVKRVKKGESIGYGRAGQASVDTLVATVPIGYADGYLRVFGKGRGKMLVGGQLVPTIGQICMDMTMLDIGGLSVKEGEEVVVFGQQPTIGDLAAWSDTIIYEILTNVSQRVKRVYLSE